jgi:hypothetical protein
LLGAHDDTDIEATPGPKVDPLPFDNVTRPPVGSRFVALPLRITNRTGRSYDEPLRGAATLITANGELPATSAPRCPSSVTVPPMSTRVGCAAFAVPYGTLIRALKLRADSGSGRETGTWALPGP